MPNKLIALVRSGTGPKLYTAEMRDISVLVRGLDDGEQVMVVTDRSRHLFSKAGCYEIADCAWLIVSAEGKCQNLICSILEKGNALRSD